MSKYRDSVRNTQRLLVQAISRPEPWLSDARLLSALASQGALAAFSDSEKQIVKMSLNSFIKHADTIADGFSGMDKLRLELKSLLAAKHKNSKPEKSTKRSSAKKISDLERKLALQDVALHEHLHVIGRLIALAKKLASDELPNRMSFYDKEMKFIRTILYHQGRENYEK